MYEAMRRRDDHELLRVARSDRDAFAEFYCRYEDPLLGFMLRRTRDAELAADLAAETFAAALIASRRYRAQHEDASAWLFGIARNVLGRSLERRSVEDRARRRLGMERIELDDETLAAINRLAEDSAVAEMLAELPSDQARAVRARVLEGSSYEAIASAMQCSQQVARKKVSRGLASLREGGRST